VDILSFLLEFEAGKYRVFEMYRIARIAILLAFVASSTRLFANGLPVNQTTSAGNLNDFPGNENDRTPLDRNIGSNNSPNNSIVSTIVNSEGPEKKVTAGTSDEKSGNAEEGESQNNSLDLVKIRKSHRRTDILVACFFFVAGVWLILATIYSIILLVLLRLQARGELDIYDENLGKMVFCNGRFTLHFGCILRRYAIQLEEDYQRQLQRRFGNSTEENEDEEPQRIRIMTREERRKAVEELLGSSEKTVDVECGNIDDKNRCEQDSDCGCKIVKTMTNTPTKLGTKSSPNTSFACSDEGPVCSICLVEYEPTDSVFRSKSCSHIFHGECLFSWLERRNNTECPICRAPLLLDEDIWDVVQRMRKERRKQLRNENGVVYRFVNWVKSKRGSNQQGTLENNRFESFTSGSSSGDDNMIDRE